MEIMIEKAKEELQMLETHHPNRFDYLKLELKSFISLLRSQIIADDVPTTSATTQASTSLKRKRVSLNRRKVEDEDRWESDRCKIEYEKKARCQSNRVDVALRKAEACLRKIQEFKLSLAC